MLDMTTKDIKERSGITINPCKTCEPVGAMFCALGVHKCMPHSHGSQGCSSYHRTVLTRHFKEPAIATSSSFTEGASVFGGRSNLNTAVKNIFDMYDPDIIAVHTTCLSETIGDDVGSYILDMEIPEGKYVIHASTPSYEGSHIQGFSNMMMGFINYLSKQTGTKTGITALFPGWVNPGDCRELKAIAKAMEVPVTMFPDFDNTMDSPMTGHFEYYGAGGTPIPEIGRLGDASSVIALGKFASGESFDLMQKKFHISGASLPMPIGIALTDRYIMALRKISKNEVPSALEAERGRLVDLLMDATSYTYKKTVAIFGDPDIAYSLTSLCLEMGMIPRYVVTGTPKSEFETLTRELIDSYNLEETCEVKADTDLFWLHQKIKNDGVDLLLGSSYGKYIARAEDIPFVRAGFPVLDRYGATIQSVCGYKGGVYLAEKSSTHCFPGMTAMLRMRISSAFFNGTHLRLLTCLSLAVVLLPPYLLFGGNSARTRSTERERGHRMTERTSILTERIQSIQVCTGTGKGVSCEKESVSGSVSQRACVYCGARVVLNPITDAYHIVHGPIGCASYTWDIRGSLSSGSELYRNSFSTDLREKDIIFGGEKKLWAAIQELMNKETPTPKLIFVYATCIVGVIGDDVTAVCKKAEDTYGIRVIPVFSPGFSGTKSTGYKIACDALTRLMLPHREQPKQFGVNILGDYNLAGEMWIIRNYLRRIGVPVIATITGDARFETLIQAPSATLNIVQCAGSSTYLANRMEAEFGVPYIKVSFFGVEDTTASICRIADALGISAIRTKAEEFVREETERVIPILRKYRPRLEGKRAAIFVGGGFKAISLMRQFRELGIQTVVVGTQTGKKDEYEILAQLADPETVILDDANPAELEQFMIEKKADILVGGVKERPLAYKLGIAFCDHNHERKHALGGFDGIENFVKEINLSINNPVWRYLDKE